MGVASCFRTLGTYLNSKLAWDSSLKATDLIDKYFNWLALAFTVLLIGGFFVIKYAL